MKGKTYCRHRKSIETNKAGRQQFIVECTRLSDILGWPCKVMKPLCERCQSRCEMDKPIKETIWLRRKLKGMLKAALLVGFQVSRDYDTEAFLEKSFGKFLSVSTTEERTPVLVKMFKKRIAAGQPETDTAAKIIRTAEHFHLRDRLEALVDLETRPPGEKAN